MFIALAIVFPGVLLLGILGMERVERPLDHHQMRVELQRFLTSDNTHGAIERLEQFVADGYRVTLKRYWRHRNVHTRRTKSTRPQPEVARTTSVALDQNESGTHVF